MSTTATKKMTPWRSIFQRRIKFPRCGIVSETEVCAEIYRAAGERQLSSSLGICLDNDTNHIVVGDSGNNRIVVIARTDGSFVRTFESTVDTHGQFYTSNICVNNAGLFIIADKFNHRVQMFTHDGTFVRAFGFYGNARGHFKYPSDVCVDVEDNIIVADTKNNRIQVFNSDGTAILRTFGTYGSSAGQLYLPIGVCVDGNGNIIVTDHNHRVQVFSADGTFVRAFGAHGRGDSQFQYPQGVCVDGADNIFVADMYNHRIQQFRSDGTFVRTFGSKGSGPTQFSSPQGVCVGADGAIYVADSGNNRICVYK